MCWGDGNDIKGNVTSAGYKDYLDVHGVSFNTNRAFNVQVGSGQEKRHRDQPVISSLSVNRSIDMASPKLFNESVAGKPAKVELYWVANPSDAAKSNPWMKLTLRSCLITSYSFSGGAAMGASENMALNFTAIQVEFFPHDAEGKALTTGSTKGFFDLLTAKCTAWA
jgi:type VI secretion system secreted protein Hcp